MDELDRMLNEYLNNLLRNKSLKEIIEDFPNIKENILKILNEYADKHNMNEVEKQKLINERYKKIKINGLSILKFDEEIENINKKRIRHLARLIIIGADPGPMTKEETDLVGEELKKQMQEDWALEDKIENAKYKRIMHYLSTTKKDDNLKAEEELKLAHEETDLYREIIDHDIDCVIDCFPPRKK